MKSETRNGRRHGNDDDDSGEGGDNNRRDHGNDNNNNGDNNNGDNNNNNNRPSESKSASVTANINLAIHRKAQIKTNIEEMRRLLNKLEVPPEQHSWISQLVGKYNTHQLKSISLGDAIDYVYSCFDFPLDPAEQGYHICKYIYIYIHIYKNMRIYDIKKFEMIETDLLRWNVSNLEYGCGTNIRNVSLMHWDQDDEFGFTGSHVMLCHGYIPLIESLMYNRPHYTWDDERNSLAPFNENGHYFDELRPDVKKKSNHKNSNNNGNNNNNNNNNNNSNNNNNDNNNKNSPSCNTNKRTSMSKGNEDDIQEQPKPLFPVHLNTQVVKVKYTTLKQHGERRVFVYCEDGTEFQGDACLITVPLGVLQTNMIKFDPPMPTWKQTAIRLMGMGNLNKLSLRFPKVFWPNKPIFGYVRPFDALTSTPSNSHAPFYHHHDSRGRFFMWWNLHIVTGEPVLITLCAGDEADIVQSIPDQELIDEAFAILKR
ncbi:hypothetical protein RFI_18864, partial [Reticulomyxa filosa]